MLPCSTFPAPARGKEVRCVCVFRRGYRQDWGRVEDSGRVGGAVGVLYLCPALLDRGSGLLMVRNRGQEGGVRLNCPCHPSLVGLYFKLGVSPKGPCLCS